MISRRRFLVGSAAAIGVPFDTHAQQAGKVYRVAVGFGGPFEMVAHLEKAMETRLSDLGYVVGRNLIIETRGSDGTPEHSKAVAADLVGLKPDVIVVWSTVGATAVKQATKTLPVVFLSVGVPVETGLVADLRKPGGNMTGVTFEAASQTYAKRLQLLKEIAPTLSRVSVLHASGDPNVKHALESIRTAAPAIGVQLDLLGVHSAHELDAAFSDIKRNGSDGVVVVAGAFTWVNRQKIAELALMHRLPSSHAFKETEAAGGLISLGPDLVEMARQGAVYVDKILRGAKPGDLPVEQPTRYEIHVNVKTAKALGLTIPQSLLLRADQVIE